ncbi:MAG: tyrosine-type recombinase/integrase [Acidimicrobiales bacterium]
MPESTRSPVPECASPTSWRDSYPTLSPDRLARELRAAVVAELCCNGISSTTAKRYGALIVATERSCRKQGWTVKDAPAALFHEVARGLPLYERIRFGTVMRAYFRILGRSVDDLASLREIEGPPPKVPERSPTSWWWATYPVIHFDRLGEELRGPLVAELCARGLTPRSAHRYAGELLKIERECRADGMTVRTAPIDRLLALSLARSVHDRARITTALRAYFPVLCRPVAELGAFRVSGTQAKRSAKRQENRKPGSDSWQSAVGPVSERLERLRLRLRRRGMSDATIRAYLQEAWSLERWCASRLIEPPTLSPDHLADYGAELSPHRRRSLRSSLRHYLAELGIDTALADAVRVPKKRLMVARPLELAEARQLLARALTDDSGRGIAVLLGLLLGLRRFEIAERRWADFSNGWLILVGKGNIEATLPVPAVLAERLARLERTGPFLFPGPGGIGHVTPTTIYNWVGELSNEAGLGTISTHRLRHTCLTYANDATGDLRSVQQFARHADPDTTAGYTRVTRDRLVAVGTSVLELLGAPNDDLSEPMVPLSVVARACSGANGVKPWLALAGLLGSRPGWRLEALSDDGTGDICYRFGEDLQADVFAYTNARPATFSLTRWIDVESEFYAWWDFAEVESMGAVLAAFEEGDRMPFPPTATTLPDSEATYAGY